MNKYRAKNTPNGCEIEIVSFENPIASLYELADEMTTETILEQIKIGNLDYWSRTYQYIMRRALDELKEKLNEKA